MKRLIAGGRLKKGEQIVVSEVQELKAQARDLTIHIDAVIDILLTTNVVTQLDTWYGIQQLNDGCGFSNARKLISVVNHEIDLKQILKELNQLKSEVTKAISHLKTLCQSSLDSSLLDSAERILNCK